jgi:hypothetical protein
LLGDVRPIVIGVLGIAFDVSLIGFQRPLAVVDVELPVVDREGVCIASTTTVPAVVMILEGISITSY